VLRVAWGHFEAFRLHSTVSGVEDRFVVYSGFPPKSLDPTKSYTWEEIREAIWERAKQAYAQSLILEAGKQEAQVRVADIRAKAAVNLAAYANTLKNTAEDAKNEAARFQVLTNVNKATPDQIQRALGLSQQDADAFIAHGKSLPNGYKSDANLRPGDAGLKGRIGFGP
jgi:hypothetical protein